MNMFLRKLAVAPIRLYQYCLSPLLPQSCRFYPTCSAYAREAIMTHGLFRGAALILLRLARCHPWSSGDYYDPVPPIVEPRESRCHPVSEEMLKNSWNRKI
jgi:hypothetical protein